MEDSARIQEARAEFLICHLAVRDGIDTRELFQSGQICLEELETIYKDPDAADNIVRKFGLPPPPSDDDRDSINGGNNGDNNGKGKGKAAATTSQTALNGAQGPHPQRQTGYNGITVDQNDTQVVAKHAPRPQTQGAPRVPKQVYQDLSPSPPTDWPASKARRTPPTTNGPAKEGLTTGCGSAPVRPQPARQPTEPQAVRQPRATATKPTQSKAAARHKPQTSVGSHTPVGQAQARGLQFQGVGNWGQTSASAPKQTARNDGEVGNQEEDESEDEGPAVTGQPKKPTGGEVTIKSFPEAEQHIVQEMCNLARARIIANGPYDDTTAEV
ncbi:hypothetical protein FRC07_010884 [Ceratobasidium sp. 392]|nr:hypothetical protein FRC07_010884 [Ceratobasidium sp. 392]